MHRMAESDRADRITRLEKPEDLGRNPTPAAWSRSDYRLATSTGRRMSTIKWYTCTPAAGPRFRLASTELQLPALRRASGQADAR